MFRPGNLTGRLLVLSTVLVVSFLGTNILANRTTEYPAPGIRSLMSLITIGCIVCYLRNRNKYVQAFVVLSAVPIAILVNSLRVFFTGVFIDLGYVRIADGFYHTFSGWLVFLGGFLLMVSISWFGEMIENRRTANPRPS